MTKTQGRPEEIHVLIYCIQRNYFHALLIISIENYNIFQYTEFVKYSVSAELEQIYSQPLNLKTVSSVS